MSFSNDVYSLLLEVRSNWGRGYGAFLEGERLLAKRLAETYLYTGELLTQPEYYTLATYVLRVKKANEVSSYDIRY